MNIRLRSFFAVLCLIPFLSTQHTKAEDKKADKKPNIFLIVSDDQGWPDLGCMGYKPIDTPRLDQLAAEGVRATNFYVAWPACTPSRSALLTGRYPQRNGLYDMVRNDVTNYGHIFTPEEYAVSPEMTLGLDPRELTIGDHLRRSGYINAVYGKWDMGQAKRYLPLQRGFDFFYGHGNNGIDYYTHERYGVPSMFRGNKITEEDKGTYATDLFEREAVSFVKAHAGKQPFFLYLPFNAPHAGSSYPAEEGGPRPGVQAPEEVVAKYRGRVTPYKQDFRNEGVAHYYAAVAIMDRAIGSVLDAIDAGGETDNTLVMFLSDNGGSGNGGNEPLRGQKGLMWEGGLRDPFIARWPGKIPAGQVTDEFITALEILPTILAATGTEAPKDLILDGFDMLPVLQGKTASSRTEMFWERRGDKAARIGKYKWVDSAKGKGLYDLEKDLGEEDDLSETHPEILKQLQDRFAAWLAEMDASEPRGPFRDY